MKIRSYFYYYLGRLFFSPYKSIVFLLVYIFILYLINWSLADCMNNGADLPLIAEAKPALSHSGLALKNSILSYVDEIEPLHKRIREQTQLISEQKLIIEALTKENDQLAQITERALEHARDARLDALLHFSDDTKNEK